MCTTFTHTTQLLNQSYTSRAACHLNVTIILVNNDIYTVFYQTICEIFINIYEIKCTIF